MNYANLRYTIIQEWNSDAKFTNVLKLKTLMLIENLLLQSLQMD